MFEVGKKYRGHLSGKIFECLAVDGKSGWLKDENKCHFSYMWGENWEEYKEPRTITRWINVYDINGELSMGPLWSSKEKAINSGCNVTGYKDTISFSYTEPL